MSSDRSITSTASDSEQLDLNRRLEMQADCLAGVFLNSVSASTGMTTTERQRIIQLFSDLGGAIPYDDDHGTGVNRAYWATLGMGAMTPGVCRTFTAPADKVA